MSSFEELKRTLVGSWRGTKHLYLEPPPAAPLSSTSSLAVSEVAGGSFLQFNYEWTYEGEPQAGVLLVGADEENAASAAWVDSFHMSSKILFSTGHAAEGAVDVRGSYAAPPGPDWSWQTVIRAGSANELEVVMHNTSPEGQEDLAVQAKFTRSES